jgi:hypothetical protein
VERFVIWWCEMEVTLTLYSLTFWAAIGFTVFGGLLGLMGTWIPEFWKSDTAIKLMITDAIFAGTSIIVAAMTKWLG